jgi:hypothetical protein
VDIPVINSAATPVGTINVLDVEIGDSSVTITDSAATLLHTVAVVAEGTNSQAIADTTVENSDASYSVNVLAEGSLTLPDSQINVNSVDSGDVVSVKTIDVNLEDSLGDPVTPTSVGLVGNTLTIEVPSGSPPSTGTYLVRFFDIDGTILKEERRNAGQDATAPTNPDYDPTYLTFAEWNQPFTNVQNDIDVGAIYDTIDGKTYLFVRITDTTGLQPTLVLNKTGTSLLTVNWGDSTTNTSSANGNITLTKTSAYSAIGDYIITIESADLHRNLSNTGIFNGNNNYSRCLLKSYEGINFRHNGNCYQWCASISIVSINKNSMTAGLSNAAFNEATALIHCNLPALITAMTNTFRNCFSLISISIPVGVTLYNGSFNGCNSLQNVIITGATDINNNAPFNNCNSLTKLIIPNACTALSANIFDGCNSLSFIKISDNLTAINGTSFAFCRSLKELEFPNTVTSIGGTSFNGCLSILQYTFLSTTPPTITGSNAFLGINPACKIYVPDASVAAYKAATNWITYANYIYPLSTKP